MSGKLREQCMFRSAAADTFRKFMSLKYFMSSSFFFFRLSWQFSQAEDNLNLFLMLLL